MPRRGLEVGALLLAPALLAIPAPSFAAFEAVDIIPFPSRGGFPAYPSEGRRPTAVYLQSGVLYDSNPFRLPTGLSARDFLGKDERSDTVVRFGAGISHEQRVFGRQSVLLAARGEYYDFTRYDAMDHFAYGLLAEWRWELGNDLGGTLAYDRSQRALDPAETRRPVLNYIISDRGLATAAYRLGPSLRLRGGLDGLNTDRKGPTRDRVQIDSRTATAGLEYVSPLANTVGVEARYTDGEAPLVAPVADVLEIPGSLGIIHYIEREVAATALYQLGTQLNFAGRLGRTQRHYTDAAVPDFDGATYRAALQWLPGNKTILGAEVYKAPRSVLDVAATDMIAKGVAASLSWSPTIKLVFSTRYAVEQRTFRGDPLAIVAGLPSRDETAHTLRFGVGWEPRRFIELSAGLEYGTRDSNLLFRDYTYTTVMANGAVRW